MRPSNQIALCILHAEIAQHRQVRFIFDSLADECPAKALCDIAEDPQCVQVTIAGIHALHEMLVHLHIIGIEFCPALEAGMPVPEVVERKAYAGAPQWLEGVNQFGGGPYSSVFSKLDGNAARQ